MRLISTIHTLLIVITVLNTTYVRSMRQQRHEYVWVIKKTHAIDKEYASHATLYNQSNNLICLPNEILKEIFSYCIVENKNKVEEIEKTIKNLLQISTISTRFHRLLTYETVGTCCRNFTLIDKNNTLKKLVYSMNERNHNTKRILALILVYAKAKHNIIHANYRSLLEKAIRSNDSELITTLFKYNVNPHEKNYLKQEPVFWYAPTIKIAQLFIDHGVNIHTIHDNTGTNILWQMLDYTYPSELLEFYLARNVDAKGLSTFHIDTSILHKLAHPEAGYINNADEYLKKAMLLLTTIPGMINTLNKQNKTPLDIAKKSLRVAQKRKLTSLPHRALVKLFRKYGGKTAQELTLQETSI